MLIRAFALPDGILKIASYFIWGRAKELQYNSGQKNPDSKWNLRSAHLNFSFETSDEIYSMSRSMKNCCLIVLPATKRFLYRRARFAQCGNLSIRLYARGKK